MSALIAKIVSGGQTGADRGGLDAAIEFGIRHGGWCPKGRRAEDGVIPARYQVIETNSAEYLVRTERNVIDSHCTVVFTIGRPKGGSKRTITLAAKHRRPCLAVDLEVMDNETAAAAVLQWLHPGGLMHAGIPVPPPNCILNVAGTRESRAPGIQQRVKEAMLMVLKPHFYAQGSE